MLFSTVPTHLPIQFGKNISRFFEPLDLIYIYIYSRRANNYVNNTDNMSRFMYVSVYNEREGRAFV